MVRRKVTRVFDLYGAEEASVGAKDVVASGAVSDSQACLCPCVATGVFAALGEVGEQVFQAVCSQKVGYLLGSRGCAVRQVNIKVAKEEWCGLKMFKPF